jgi:hypothetical protein
MSRSIYNFWVLTPCSYEKVAYVLDEHSAPIFRVERVDRDCRVNRDIPVMDRRSNISEPKENSKPYQESNGES